MDFIFVLILSLSTQVFAENQLEPQLIYQATLESCRATHFDPTDSQQEIQHLSRGLPGQKLNQLLFELSKQNQFDQIDRLIGSRAFYYATLDCFKHSPSDQLHFKYLVEYQFNSIIQKHLAGMGVEFAIGLTVPSLLALKFIRIRQGLNQLYKWSIPFSAPLVIAGSAENNHQVLQNLYLQSTHQELINQKQSLEAQLKYHVKELEFLINSRCELEPQNCQLWQRSHLLFFKLINNT